MPRHDVGASAQIKAGKSGGRHAIEKARGHPVKRQVPGGAARAVIEMVDEMSPLDGGEGPPLDEYLTECDKILQLPLRQRPNRRRGIHPGLQEACGNWP